MDELIRKQKKQRTRWDRKDSFSSREALGDGKEEVPAASKP